jgi:hypothetical protein
MNWSEFNEAVRTFLLVDSERKGKGVQNYIDRMIVASVIDLQRYIPSFRSSNIKHYSTSNLVEPNPETLSGVNSEDINAHQGEFDQSKTRIKEVLVRRIPTENNQQDISQYFYLSVIPWSRRFEMIDGANSERTQNIPGRIAFGDTSFITAPKLRNDEALYLYYEGEKHYTPIFKADENELQDPVVFDDLVAKASADFVKAHLSREVDNDLAQYQSYFQLYVKGRSQIFINEKEYASSSARQVLGSGVGGFVIG